MNDLEVGGEENTIIGKRLVEGFNRKNGFEVGECGKITSKLWTSSYTVNMDFNALL
jgi:hypothetical protein